MNTIDIQGLDKSFGSVKAIDYLSRLRGRTDRRRKQELLERFELDPTKKVALWGFRRRDVVGG